ncbi:hypothetical protein TNIN_460671 [Trichonephila inaurata madagascariensis]|uniref:Uncharacterized protein n=1 Tax=Trichonephila inaurata madagascariensis TaxID=2747483 RepID=A0A8X6M9K6_9ARAC|nr:hypothetical protein TNIN_460671 [Trichonephila inaurata madagascariensis]
MVRAFSRFDYLLPESLWLGGCSREDHNSGKRICCILSEARNRNEKRFVRNDWRDRPLMRGGLGKINFDPER